MNTTRMQGTRRPVLPVLAGAALLLGLSLSGPAYAAAPGTPPGQDTSAATASDPAAARKGDAQTGRKSGQETVHETGRQNSAGGTAGSHVTSGTAGTSGPVTEPQPRSNADDNGGGANHTGPYDSTRDGSASGNGNGGGQATGKPCAGCVGKADNKNPQGQYPDASDGNAGYECDRNHGIARTNPAHTGCRTVSPPTVCVDNPATPQDECNPPNVCVDNPATPQDECNPPNVCVDNPATPLDECGSVSPPIVCVDNPATPLDECGSVSPPGGEGAPPVTTSVSVPGSAAAAALPETGAPSGLLWAALAGLLLLGAGGVVTTRIRA